ncbi:unnamed protein product [Prunus armeniaca]|uniref:Uncharacterized protein n=1 Tax=Prunus armeniaca TaxID=36596 RepID=A0A6J5UKS5_PRUAR|nr:unnamed protein product [Prunus armeniaca]CAB4307107.1 unnamed protein product [Prunus armeniaca]
MSEKMISGPRIRIPSCVDEDQGVVEVYVVEGFGQSGKSWKKCLAGRSDCWERGFVEESLVRIWRGRGLKGMVGRLIEKASEERVRKHIMQQEEKKVDG